MRSESWTSRRRWAAVLAATLVVAACGGDDDDDADSASTEATSAPADTAAGDTTAGEGTTAAAGDERRQTTAPGATTGDTEGDSETTDAGSAPAGSAGCPEIDMAADAENGDGAGRLMSDLQCAADSPLAAEGEPIVIGLQNPEGDPNGSFPEFSSAAQAAVDYINDRARGLGRRRPERRAGPPDPARGLRDRDLARRLAALRQRARSSKDPFMVASSINFFGNHLPIFQAADVPAIVMSPVTIADFTTEGVYSIGGGGGCLGVHTGMVEFVTSEFEVDKVVDPVGRHAARRGLLLRPRGQADGRAQRHGRRATPSGPARCPTSTYLGVPIKPATPDVTPQVDRGPRLRPGRDHLLGPGRRLLEPRRRPRPPRLDAAGHPAGALGRLHRLRGDARRRRPWPRACTSSARATRSSSTRRRSEDPVTKFAAETYQAKAAEYGMPEADITKGFGALGFTSMVTLWSIASAADRRRRGDDAGDLRRRARPRPTTGPPSGRPRCRAPPRRRRTWQCATRSSPPTSGTATTFVPVRPTVLGHRPGRRDRVASWSRLNNVGTGSDTPTACRTPPSPTRTRTRGARMDRNHHLPDPRSRPGIDLRHAGRRARGACTRAPASSTSPTGRWRCTACSRSTRPAATGPSSCRGSTSCPRTGSNLPVRSASPTTGSDAWTSAVVIALVMAALIGLLVHFLVFRPLRHAPPLGKVVGSLGMLLYLQGVALLNFGGTGRQPERRPRRATPELPRPRLGRPQVNMLLAVGISRRRRPGPLVLLPLHPLRAGHPRRGRQREGRHPARLHAPAPGRRQLDHRGGARRHRRHPRRPGAGLAHPVGLTPSSSPPSAPPCSAGCVDPRRHRRRPRRSAPCRARAVLGHEGLVPELLPHRRPRCACR